MLRTRSLAALILCLSLAPQPVFAQRTTSTTVRPATFRYVSPPRLGQGENVACSGPKLAGAVMPAYRAQFRPACIEHDFCYRHGWATYGWTQKQCDDRMHAAMIRLCNESHEGPTHAECLGRATTISGTLAGAGGRHFQSSSSTVAEYESRLHRNRPRWPRVGDVNGDGRADLVFYFPDAASGLLVRTKFSTASRTGQLTWTGVEHPVRWGNAIYDFPTLMGDFDADGRSDLVFMWHEAREGLKVRTLLSRYGAPQNTGSRPRDPTTGQWVGHHADIRWGARVLDHPVLVGDVNGDRRSDLVFRWWDGGRGLRVRVLLANGQGGWSSAEHVVGWGARVLDFPTLLGDVNGDGRADLILPRQKNRNTFSLRVLYGKADGRWIEEGDWDIGWRISVHPAMLGDTDGDGRSDLIFPFQNGSEGLRVNRLHKSGSGWSHPSHAIRWGADVHEYPTLVGDISGDGRDDLVFVRQAGSAGLEIRTLIANPNGTWAGAIDRRRWGRGVHEYPTALADVDGDGRADLIFAFQDGARGLQIRTLRSNGQGGWSGAIQTTGDGPGIVR